MHVYLMHIYIEITAASGQNRLFLTQQPSRSQVRAGARGNLLKQGSFTVSPGYKLVNQAVNQFATRCHPLQRTGSSSIALLPQEG